MCLLTSQKKSQDIPKPLSKPGWPPLQTQSRRIVEQWGNLIVVFFVSSEVLSNIEFWLWKFIKIRPWLPDIPGTGAGFEEALPGTWWCRAAVNAWCDRHRGKKRLLCPITVVDNGMRWKNATSGHCHVNTMVLVHSGLHDIAVHFAPSSHTEIIEGAMAPKYSVRDGLKIITGCRSMTPRPGMLIVFVSAHWPERNSQIHGFCLTVMWIS